MWQRGYTEGYGEWAATASVDVEGLVAGEEGLRRRRCGKAVLRFLGTNSVEEWWVGLCCS